MPHRQPAHRQNPTGPESRSRALLALAITCFLVVLVLGMVALIGYRSIMVHGPSTAVVIGGDSSLDGAKIEVTESIAPHLVWKSTLESSNEWQTPILLDPGPYHVNVTHQGKNILNEDFAPDQFNGVRFDLPSLVNVIGNDALGGARIDIAPLGDATHLSRPKVVKLGSDNHFRQTIYLLAGEYRAIAHTTTGADRILAQMDFTVQHQTPTRVDLTKPATTDQ